MDGFLKQFQIKKGENDKIITHTSMKGGKWSIPKEKLSEFYQITKDNIVNGPENKLLVEKMHDYFPFVIDIDLKEDHELFLISGQSISLCDIIKKISKNGSLNLGTWQGIFLCEHRNQSHTRRITV